MRKKMSCIALCLVVFLCCSGVFSTVLAQEQRIFDYAGLLTAGKIESLEDRLEEMKETSQLDVVVVTIEDAQGKSSKSYADDFYDDGGFGEGSEKSGVLLLIDMDNREAYISTCGKGIQYLTDARCDRILDVITAKLGEQEYASAVEYFIGQVKSYEAAGVPDHQYQYDEETGETTGQGSLEEKGFSIQHILIFLLVSVAAGGIGVGIVVKKYQWNYRQNTYPVHEKSRIHMKNSQDVFLRKHTNTRRIPQNTGSASSVRSSSGRSTTHTSRSGSTHGGRGRKF